MKVIAFNGSPRPKGNTARMIREVFAVLEEAGIRTELISLAGKPLPGCSACGDCAVTRDRRCSIVGDDLNDYVAKMIEADGIILASPTYFSDVTAEMKALIDRAGLVVRMNGDLLKRKVGAAIAVARRAGGMHTFDTLNHFFLINQMVVCGSSYWNLGFGLEQEDVARDSEGIGTMRTLGENMAWLLQRLQVEAVAPEGP